MSKEKFKELLLSLSKIEKNKAAQLIDKTWSKLTLQQKEELFNYVFKSKKS